MDEVDGTKIPRGRVLELMGGCVVALHCILRYAGEHCSYPDNNKKLLRELAGKDNRSAQFRTVIALSDPEGNVQTVEGACPGVIIEELRGSNGFGYDPLFVPDGYTETFAELASKVKNRISHRARSLQKAHNVWAEILGRII